jgi:hypothetical protein
MVLSQGDTLLCRLLAEINRRWIPVSSAIFTPSVMLFKKRLGAFQNV